MLKNTKLSFKTCNILSFTLAAIVGFVGLAEVFSWIMQAICLFELPPLLQMHIFTALAFSFSGIGLLMYYLFPTSRLSYIAKFFGALVFLLGFAILVQYILTAFDLVIYRETKVWLMAPNTAFCFIILGLILLLLQRSLVKKLYFYPLLLSTLIALFSSLVLLDYTFSFSSTFGWGGLRNMSLLSATLFFLLSISAWIFLFLKTLKTGISNQVYLAPLVVFVIVSLLCIGLFEILTLKERMDLRKAIASFLPQIETRAKEVVALQHSALKRMVTRINDQHYILNKQWHNDAISYLQDNSELMLITILDKDLSPKFYQSKLTPEQTKRLLEQIKEELPKVTIDPFVSQPLLSVNDNFASWIVMPVSPLDASSAYLATYYNYHKLFEDFLSPPVKQLINVTWYYQNKVAYESINGESFIQGKQWAQQHQFTLNGYPFTITVWPTPLFIDKYLSYIPAGFLIFSLPFALMFAILVYYWQMMNTSKKNLQLIIDSVNHGIYGLDSEGKIIFFNQVGAKMLGYAPEEMLGKVQLFLNHHSYPSSPYPRETYPIYTSFKDGQSRLVESEVFWRKDGTSFPVEYQTEPMFSKHGKLIGAVVSFSDITERKRMEQQIKERNAALEASNKALEAFSYSVSHDLKAPLRHILGFIDLMKQDRNNQFSEEGKRHLSIIGAAAAKMSRLIDDLLKISRAGQVVLKVKPISLNKLIKEIEQEFNTEISDRNISLQYSDLPSVYGDENLMRSVLMNLISNAIKFTEQKKKPLIEIKAQEKQDDYEISVRDNGVGFEPQYSDKIFETFQRLHKDSEFEGTGIGLAIVAKIINRHGGRVWAESEINRGTTIYFTLPKRTELWMK
ncbi:PAS domain-containing sensor histidine kinase [Legionella yabuuchiae]|uniref:PAS domain-containing sensor histidine kinase n=1 Tax=Legionella yabuuchiae TaxID=376727 RepID=UPI0010541C1D|nr:ATP-binding protein [Legionella yabuuchiae]